MARYPTGAMPPIKYHVFAFFIALVLWLLLTGSLQPDELMAGVLVALVVTLAAGRRLAVFTGVKLTPAAVPHLVRYLSHFSAALVRANLDMARRVLSPSLPIRPGVVEVRTDLHSPLGKLLLANSITLTPGTLAVDVQDDHLLVHWVDCEPGTDLEAATRAIAESFERHISGFLQ